ncbi:RNA polymerase sigma-54 factor, partial [Alkalihalophilus lindianensis]|nr:RNA polymerase sigma-54 factor [Alkalihalophilus lindianensis]
QPMNPLIDRNRKKHQKVEKDWIEQIAVKSFSLEEQLISQFNIKAIPEVQLRVIRYLILHLDENGYFTGDLDEISVKLKIPYQLTEDCLKMI